MWVIYEHLISRSSKMAASMANDDWVLLKWNKLNESRINKVFNDTSVFSVK